MDADRIHERWAEYSGEYSPEYYAEFGPNETSYWLADLFDRLIDRDDAILELGCSAGRHLSHLHEEGYTDLHGIEINDAALDHLEETFPELAAAGTFHHGAIEEVVPDLATGRFDAVFSVETLQHVPPENAWVFEEIARVTDDVLVTVENEDARDDRIVLPTEFDVDYVDGDVPLYHRKWSHVFTRAGLVSIDSIQLEMDTFRVFRSPEA